MKRITAYIRKAIGGKGERGFALLFSVLIASVLLSIGLSIFNLTVKELALSGSSRESQFSFYAADTGIECALYWEFKGTQVFATSTRSTNPSNIDCVDSIGTPQYINTAPDTSSPTAATTTFSLIIPNLDDQGNPANYCTTVVVAKWLDGAIIRTRIDSRGYNTCTVTDINRVERAIQVHY